jgi:hypothetical protein
MVHFALINRILDTYLGYQPRDWAAEGFARLPEMERARDSVARVMDEMKSAAPPPLPLGAHAGSYQHPLFGPVHVRAGASGLTLQMGEGEVADLEYHGGDAFFTRWRDPLYREHFGTHVQFVQAGDSIVRLTTRINRDEFTADRAGDAPNSDAPAWRPSWPGTEMAVISGDPAAAGPFSFRFRMPDGYWICPHTHPVEARIRVVAGTFLVGMGSALDTAVARALPAAATVTLAPGVAHYEGARGETVIEIAGAGPWGVTFLDPRRDPSRAGGACRL